MNNNLSAYPTEYNLFAPQNIRDKPYGVRQYMTYNINRTQAMFEHKGLPDNIPQREFELALQCRGVGALAEVTPKAHGMPKAVYFLRGTIGGVQNEWFLGTKFIGANPYLGIDYELEIGKECVLVRNDTMMMGIIPMLNRTAVMMVENDITMYMQSINKRLEFFIKANTDREKVAADEFLKNIEAGYLSALLQNPLFEGITTQPYANQSDTSNDIEYQQYLKAALFNDLGLDANYNMKREAINSVEAQMNDDALAPYIDDMLNNRKIACEEANAMFGWNWTVDLSSSWKKSREETTQAVNKGGEVNEAEKTD